MRSFALEEVNSQQNYYSHSFALLHSFGLKFLVVFCSCCRVLSDVRILGVFMDVI